MASERPMSRDEWRGAQSRLKDLGFYFGEVDGLRGPLTDNAIVAFKRSIGFNPRPFFGPQTWSQLFSMGPPFVKGVGTLVSELPWISYARSILGYHERRDSAALRKWFGNTVASWVDPSEVSWCGAFVATCLKKWDPDLEVPTNILGARQWGNFGEACVPQRGAILTFWRVSKSSWQGHVGFMVGQDSTTYHVLGGNQSDAVTITRLDKGRLLQSRWPTGYPQPNDRAFGTLAGTISTNEA